MANTESRYSSIQKGDVDIDLENDSDATLASTGFLKKNGESKKQTRARSARSNMLVWLRWCTIVVLQGIIVLQLFRNGGEMKSSNWTQSETETGGDVNGLYIPSEFVENTYWTWR